jgi:hypothetical protein
MEESIYLRQIYKMQLNKECVENENSKRLFILSKDNKQGEIFGIKNLFTLNDDQDNCLTRYILKRYTNIENGIAGLKVSNFVSANEIETNESEAKSNDDTVIFEDTYDEDDTESITSNECEDNEYDMDLVTKMSIECDMSIDRSIENESASSNQPMSFQDGSFDYSINKILSNNLVK